MNFKILFKDASTGAILATKMADWDFMKGLIWVFIWNCHLRNRNIWSKIKRILDPCRVTAYKINFSIFRTHDLENIFYDISETVRDRAKQSGFSTLAGFMHANFEIYDPHMILKSHSYLQKLILLHCIHTHIYNPGCYKLNLTRFPVHTQTPSGLGSGLEK